MPLRDANKYRLFLLLVLASLSSYAVIAYGIPRTAFIPLILLMVVLFAAYWLAIKKFAGAEYFNSLMSLALVARLIFVFAVPSLSDDYFRFIWDGVLTNAGINPYLYQPQQLHGVPGTLPMFLDELKFGMNSLPYYSPYPPVAQAIFWISVKLGGHQLLNNIMIMRLTGLLAEAGSIWVMLRMLGHFKLPRRLVFLYALNPLVILELTGNLHGESLLIFFLLSSFYLLAIHRNFAAAVLLGLAVATKLLPLIFLPAILSYSGLKKGLAFCLVTMLTLALTFLPFFNAVFLEHIGQSVSYYFQKFEFNASIYYLLRWIGYDITGFNMIYFIGKLLPLLALALILRIAFSHRIENIEMLLERLLSTLLVYYLFSLIVHPWYLTVLVAITVFSKQRFALAWSGLVMPTYSTYLQKPYNEILWLTALEYVVLAAIILTEWRTRKRRMPESTRVQ